MNQKFFKDTFNKIKELVVLCFNQRLLSIFFFQQQANPPIIISLKVPPQTAVINAMIKIPNTSNFFCIAANTTETVKATVPKNQSV